MNSSFVFPNWWQALSAVPSSKLAKDWWAPNDARCPRYDRLYRAWGDPTDGVPPPYYKLEKEKHVVPTLWENFALFNPANTVASVYRALAFDACGPASDLCWSCEFNLGHQDRQLDIVMHVRFADRDEILIGEAKAGRKRFDDKDLAPSNILSRDVIKFASNRRYFLLGDAPPPEDWHARGYRHMTWKSLYALQAELCKTLPESPAVRDLVRRLIQAQFEGHGIATDASRARINAESIQREASELSSTIETAPCREFIACATQHVRCLQGLRYETTPFPYLASEPTVEQIKRHWRLGCGGLAVNGKAYWKLPTRYS
jgi:hypothetical protein